MSVARYPEVRAKMSVSAKIRQDNLSSDGNHVWQTPESRQRAAQQQLDKIERGEFHLHDPVKRSEWDKRNSELQRERGRRGEHASQRPEVKAKMRRTWVARSAKFGCPLHTPEAQEKLRIRMASPEIREKCRDAALARHARERLEHWEESGQGFLLDMNLDD